VVRRASSWLIADSKNTRHGTVSRQQEGAVDIIGGGGGLRTQRKHRENRVGGEIDNNPDEAQAGGDDQIGFMDILQKTPGR